jgi:hypothetical protein
MRADLLCQRCGYRTTRLTNFKRHCAAASCPATFADVPVDYDGFRAASQKPTEHQCSGCSKYLACAQSLCAHRRTCAKAAASAAAGAPPNAALADFGEEDAQHLLGDLGLLSKCAKTVTGSGLAMCVERLHFHPGFPQNRNVRVRSLKHKLMEVVKDGTWQAENTTVVLDAVMKRCLNLMNEHYARHMQAADIDEDGGEAVVYGGLQAAASKYSRTYYEVRSRVFTLILRETERDKQKH